MDINKGCGEMTNTSQKPQFEYGMNEQLKNLLTEIKTCAFSVLMDKGYTKEKADKSIAKIKNFDVYETETGFRIETLVDEYEIAVFHHNDEIKVAFYCDEEHKMRTKNSYQIYKP